MRLIGKYTFEVLQRCLQGVFAFYKSNDLFILELFTARFVFAPNEYVEIYVLIGQTYTKIGKVNLE